ncbi:AraC family transcriptional regulator [Pedobacter borealis]|uniref:AraC family transcriptional regulator n=1 Tax=Pedobacter borealis TaxID=475254 RepID=UPI000493038D|nr:AraC family transcriptional regulator [Pedobacter borealis]
MQLDVKSTRNRTIINFQKEGYDDLCVLGRYKYSKAEKYLEEHTHVGMIEICYCDKGSQLFFVNNKKHLVNGGDIFIHFPGEVHSTGGEPEERGCLYWLIIKIDNIKLKPGNKICANVASLLDLIIKKEIRHFRGGDECKKILETIFKKNALRKKTVVEKIWIEHLVQNFLLHVLDKVSGMQTETIDKRLDVITEHITNNLTEYISIEDLANKIHLSESRFKIWFKQNTGFSPIDYIQRQRIFLAIKIINDQPDISITKLAYSLNFSTPQYFSTVMRKYTGKTPTEIKAG